MTSKLFAGILAACVTFITLSHAAPSVPTGEYATARTADDERVQLMLLTGGKAQIIAEHNFQIPGDEGKRRGRTTSYGKWSQKGDVVTLTYSRIKDRLRFDSKTSLAKIGLAGVAPALTQFKPVHTNSRLKGATLWKAPHDYRLKAPADESPIPSTPRGAGEPAQ